MNRRAFGLLLTIMILAVTLLIQRSLTTYYAYRCSELAQDKKLLLKQAHSLEVEVHRACRPEVLYSYWKEHKDRFDFNLPQQESSSDENVAEEATQSQQEAHKASSSKPPILLPASIKHKSTTVAPKTTTLPSTKKNTTKKTPSKNEVLLASLKTNPSKSRTKKHNTQPLNKHNLTGHPKIILASSRSPK